MKDKLQDIFDYNKCKFVTFPGIIFPNPNGIRLCAKLINDKVILYNGDKIYSFPNIEKELYTLLNKFSNITLECIIGLYAEKEDVKTLLKHKDIILKCSIIDTFLEDYPDVILTKRLGLFAKLKSYFYLNINSSYIKFINFETVSSNQLLDEAIFDYKENGFKSFIYKAGKQKNPTIENKKQYLLKLEYNE